MAMLPLLKTFYFEININSERMWKLLPCWFRINHESVREIRHENVRVHDRENDHDHESGRDRESAHDRESDHDPHHRYLSQRHHESVHGH